MAFKLSESEYEQLDAFFGDMLDAYQSGKYSKPKVVSVLSFFIACASADNAGELRRWLADSETLPSWMSQFDAHRT